MLDGKKLQESTFILSLDLTIPIRRKYGISKGSKVMFVEMDKGIQLVPLVMIINLFGIDGEKENIVQSMIREILDERK